MELREVTNNQYMMLKPDDSRQFVKFRVYRDLKESGRTDEEIFAMSPKERFLAFCEWNGLLGSWGETLWDVTH